jgi:hypothetical protein
MIESSRFGVFLDAGVGLLGSMAARRRFLDDERLAW